MSSSDSRYDVIVIGSGFGGAMAAHAPVLAGARALALVCGSNAVWAGSGVTAGASAPEVLVEEVLGAPRYMHDLVNERELRPGVAVGLAWTPVGGEVLFVESTMMPAITASSWVCR